MASVLGHGGSTRLRITIDETAAGAAAVEWLLHFIYDLPVSLRIPDACTFYEAAVRYGFEEAEATSLSLLRALISSKACAAYELTSKCESVQKLAWEHIVGHVDGIVASKHSELEFLRTDTIIKLLADENLAVTSEKVMLRLIFRWTVGSQERKKVLPILCSKIRWTNISYSILLAAATDEIGLVKQLQLEQFADWQPHLVDLVEYLCTSQVVVKALDRVFRTDAFRFRASEVSNPDAIDSAATEGRRYTPLETMARERDALNDHCETLIGANETWYLVSSAWFSSWKDHVNRWEQNERPPPIDNTKLLRVHKGDMLLRSNLQSGVDFELVSAALWRQLAQWYGGGPPLSRRSYRDLMTGAWQVEIDLQVVNVGIFSHTDLAHGCPLPSHLTKVEVSRFLPASKFMDIACQALEDAGVARNARGARQQMSRWDWSAGCRTDLWMRAWTTNRREVERRAIKDLGIDDGATVCFSFARQPLRSERPEGAAEDSADDVHAPRSSTFYVRKFGAWRRWTRALLQKSPVGHFTRGKLDRPSDHQVEAVPGTQPRATKRDDSEDNKLRQQISSLQSGSEKMLDRLGEHQRSINDIAVTTKLLYDILVVQNRRSELEQVLKSRESVRHTTNQSMDQSNQAMSQQSPEFYAHSLVCAVAQLPSDRPKQSAGPLPPPPAPIGDRIFDAFDIRAAGSSSSASSVASDSSMAEGASWRGLQQEKFERNLAFGGAAGQPWHDVVGRGESTTLVLNSACHRPPFHLSFPRHFTDDNMATELIGM
jgi:hypothetical protein